MVKAVQGVAILWLLLPLMPPLSAWAAVLTGSELAMHSSGIGHGTDWTLDSTGYVGTYITLAAPGQVTLSAQAAGNSTDAVLPRMNFVIADTKAGFDVGGRFNTYQHTFDLPVGTYFVRTEFANDVPTADRQLIIRDLDISGATVRNSSELGPAGLDAMLNFLAVESANTYIENFRKGSVSVALGGVAPGTPVEVRLKRHAFNFGTALNGSTTNNVNSYLGSNGTAKQTNFQERLLQNFNAVVPGNAGKWLNNEFIRDSPNMGAVNQMLDFAESHGMSARMHNLLWGDDQTNGQQPGWVLNDGQSGLLDQAAAGDIAAAAELRQEISERIAYYVGDGPGGSDDPSRRYTELDVYNESFHTGAVGIAANYWKVYGPEGVADIYRETKLAATNSGGIAKTYLNEYNVLSDEYAQWYVDHFETIQNAGRAAGYGDVIDGIGAQYYPSSLASHVPRRVMQGIQNLAVLDLPFTLTEFAIEAGVSQTDAATILEQTMRLVFGNATSTGFFMWGFHQESGFGANQMYRPGSALYTVNTGNFNNWTITPAGIRYEWLFGLRPDSSKRGANASPWDTQLTAIVDENGTINFKGFWGEYELVIDGHTYRLALVKGTSQYALVAAPEPATMTVLLLGLASIVVPRCRRADRRSGR